MTINVTSVPCTHTHHTRPPSGALFSFLFRLTASASSRSSPMDNSPELGSWACMMLAGGPRGSALAVFLSNYAEDGRTFKGKYQGSSQSHQGQHRPIKTSLTLLTPTPHSLSLPSLVSRAPPFFFPYITSPTSPHCLSEGPCRRSVPLKLRWRGDGWGGEYF